MPATDQNGVSATKEEGANNDSIAPPREVDELGIPKGAKTSEFYRVHEKLPARFDNPDWFQGYRSKPGPHPQYRTSNGDYGGRNPNVHTMQTQFHGRSQKFSQHLGVCGMYRNHSFNTYVEKSKVNGVDNLITMEEKNNFHRSYNPNGPAML
ncbi:piercer of microtubule wall 1 protein-like [Branchiostoma floridae x Branchiostoma belcheri]